MVQIFIHFRKDGDALLFYGLGSDVESKIIRNRFGCPPLRPPLSKLFPGSGNIRKTPHNEIIRKIEYLKELGECILALYSQGLSYSQIRCKLLGPEIAIAYVTLCHFKGKNFIRSFIEDQPHMNDTKEGAS